MEKNEEENEDEEEEKDLRCWFGIGSKAYNLIYKPSRFQKKIPNSYGENDPIVQTNSTLEFLEIFGPTSIQNEKVMYFFELQIQTLKAIPILNVKVILAYSRLIKCEIQNKYYLYVVNFLQPWL